MHRRGLRLPGQLPVCPPRLKLPLRRKLLFFLNSITAEFHVGLDKKKREGAWRRRFVIDPDNFTVSSDIGKICAQGEGAWRRRLHKLTCCPLFQGQSKGPSKFLCTSLLLHIYLWHCCLCIAGAVVIAFVVCWLPYHARRLMFCYVTQWTV